MTFCKAFELLKNNKLIARESWLDKFLRYSKDSNEIMKVHNNLAVPWLAPSADLLANDWLEKTKKKK